jgi:hypothetical protein
MTARLNILRSTSPTRLARTGVGLKVFGGEVVLVRFDLNARGTLVGLTDFFQTRGRPAAILVSSLSTSVGVMSVTLRVRQSGKTNVLSMLALICIEYLRLAVLG